MYRLVVPTAVLFAACGCQPETHGTLSGKVTLNGQPVKGGTIQFMPVDGNATSASCFIQEDGTYQARVPATTHKVVISSTQLAGKAGSNPTTDEGTPVREVIPKKYNDQSKLTVSVEPKQSGHDFELVK